MPPSVIRQRYSNIEDIDDNMYYDNGICLLTVIGDWSPALNIIEVIKAVYLNDNDNMIDYDPLPKK
jgi:hypothetical protein